MARSRFLHRRDKIEPDVIEALQKHGIYVKRLRGGHGEPDLLCFHLADGYWQPGEVKSGEVRKRPYVMRRRTRKRGSSDSRYTTNSTKPSTLQTKGDTEKLWPTWASVADALRSFGLS